MKEFKMFVIETPNGYVHGFSKTHQCVQVTNTLGLAKQWKRKGMAQKFLDKYSNCGYGLNSDSAEVVDISQDGYRSKKEREWDKNGF